MDEPTAELVRRAQEGDELALERVVRAVHPTLYRWALLRTNDADDADDVAQAALMRVHQHLRDFSFGSRFTTWLYSIVRTAAVDWHRARRRQRARDERYGRDAARVVAAPDPERIDIERRLAGLRDAFRTLPARQREVFDMVELQGMNTTEVGEILGVSASTVRVHLLRARRALRSKMLER